MGSQGRSLLISGARLLTKTHVIDAGWLHVENGKIVGLGSGEPPVSLARAMTNHLIDAHGQFVVPGFIDIHVHGADGFSVMDGTPKAIASIGRFHAGHGTTGWLPTTLTAPVSELEKSIVAVADVRNDETDDTGAGILGLHLEGPFISPNKIGAQNPDYVHTPSVDVMHQLASLAPGLIRKVTIAPERDGALDVIRWLSHEGIISSIGHTDGTFAETMLGIEAGATHATHLFNAMRGLHHREGGVVGACLLSEKVVCELIADGHHVDVEVMKLIVKTKGKHNVALITDAISATGKPDGHYQLGGLDIIVQDGKSILKEGHNLAGSTLTMDLAVRNMVKKVGVTLADAIEMASTVPAREIGLESSKGIIAIGYDADLVLLDESLSVARTFVNGREVFCRS
jgi:N-acetylglucosamine-6-phosphate deacetylase